MEGLVSKTCITHCGKGALKYFFYVIVWVKNVGIFNYLRENTCLLCLSVSCLYCTIKAVAPCRCRERFSGWCAGTCADRNWRTSTLTSPPSCPRACCRLPMPSPARWVVWRREIIHSRWTPWWSERGWDYELEHKTVSNALWRLNNLSPWLEVWSNAIESVRHE